MILFYFYSDFRKFFISEDIAEVQILFEIIQQKVGFNFSLGCLIKEFKFLVIFFYCFFRFQIIFFYCRFLSICRFDVWLSYFLEEVFQFVFFLLVYRCFFSMVWLVECVIKLSFCQFDGGRMYFSLVLVVFFYYDWY